jgi:hypothetical protein
VVACAGVNSLGGGGVCRTQLPISRRVLFFELIFEKRGDRTQRWAKRAFFLTATSDQVRLPAEFKHISKRRKRN